MAEVATEGTWSELIKQHVYAPLGMHSSNFGWPAKSREDAQPLGHGPLPTRSFQALEIADYSLGPYIAPAGDLSSTVGDLALHTLAHMRGVQEIDGILRANTFGALHLPSELDGGPPYAGGWIVSDLDEEHERHYHNGSTGTFYAVIEFYPHQDRGLIILINAADFAEIAVGSLVNAARERFDAQLEED